MAKLKCKVCGVIYEDARWGDLPIPGTGLLDIGKEKLCPDCKRARAMSGGSFAGGGASNVGVSNVNTKADIAAAKAQEAAAKAEKARIEAEEKRRRDEEYERAREAHKQAIAEIKEFVFPENDEEFSRAANKFCDDYLDCNPGLLADGEYKKAYQKRMATELKILKDSNPARYEKLNGLWAETSESMKKKVKVRLIISGIICGVVTIGCGILIAVCDDGNFFAGCGLGLFFGALFGLWPQSGFKSKTDEE